MGFFRAARAAGGHRFFEAKVLLFVTGASLGVAGMLTERSWLVWTAIAVLACGVALRMRSRRKEGEEEES